MPWPHDRPFKILSIDGGGIKGILPAALLTEIESALLEGGSVAKHFDMIAGTSTGGIIAIGLGLGMRAQEILDLYMNHGDRIFPSAPPPFRQIGRLGGGLKQFARRRYNPTVLDQALEKVLERRKFGLSQNRLVIPAFDHNTEPCIFKTPHHPDYKLDWNELALTVARATSAAPTYLEGLENGGRRFWDGGVFANNPIMMALTDALACNDIRRQQVQILSIGCATDPPRLSKRHLRAGFLGWRNAHAVASSLQSHDAVGQAGLLIGRHRVLRIDESLAKPIDMDDYHSAAGTLPEVANRLFVKHREGLETFIGQQTIPYKAFYGPRSNSDPDSP